MRKLIFMIIVFVAAFSLFFIFDSINKLAENCKREIAPSEICKNFSGLTMNMVILLLFISGFIFIIGVSAYIMLLG